MNRTTAVFRCSAILVSVILAMPAAVKAQVPPKYCVSTEDKQLADLINAYRSDNEKPAAPLSFNLMKVAHWHVWDSTYHNAEVQSPVKENSCNLHSWSSARPLISGVADTWSAVCYTENHARAQGMWDKPGEIPGGTFSGNGFEISHRNGSNATPVSAFTGWQNSKPHNEVMLNLAGWSGFPWTAMGVGILGNYSHVWFSNTADSATPMPLCAHETAGISVTSEQDVIADDGLCTLREAITAANTDTASGATPGECIAGSGPDTISLPPGTYTLAIPGTSEDNNASGDLDILSDITIRSLDYETTIVQGGTDATNGIDRVFAINRNVAVVAIHNVTIRHGRQAGVAWPHGAGSAIWNQGQLEISGSSITDNGGEPCGGAIYNYNGARLTVTGSTISNNRGGWCPSAIQNDSAAVVLSGTTISGNSSNNALAGPLGALTGVRNIPNQTSSFEITNTTIAQNTHVANASGGLTIFGPATATVRSSILTGNTGPQCIGAITGTTNAIDDETCGASAGRLAMVRNLDATLKKNGA